MPSIRKSIIFAIEDKLGGGLPKGGHYIHAPPHSFISHTPNRSTNRLNASGTKKFDTIAYGKVSGTWDWSFVLDYDYLEPLTLIFESVNGSTDKDKDGTLQSDNSEQIQAIQRNPGYDDTLFAKIEIARDDYDALQDKADNTVYHVSDVVGGETKISDYCCRKKEVVRCIGGWGDYTCIVYTYNGMFFSEPVEINGEVVSTPQAAYIYKDGNKYTYYLQSDGYTVDKDGKLFNGSAPVFAYVVDSSARYKHTFEKVDWGRVKSFTVRQVILNRMAGGTADEVLELRGCVVKSVTFRQAAGASQIQVSLSGANTWDKMWLGEIKQNDYRDTDGQLIEFGCVFIGGAGENGIPKEENKAGQTDSWEIEINNNADMIDTTCGPRSVNYEEGQSEYGFKLTLYSNNPFALQQRLYTGGQDIVKTMPGVQTFNGKYLWIPEPMCKNLKPLNRADILSYNTCVKDLGGTGGTKTIDAYKAASKSLHVIVKKVVIKSLGWQRGEGQKLQDNVTAECREVIIETVGKVQNWFKNSKNYVKEPMGPRWSIYQNKWVTGPNIWKEDWDPNEN